MTTEGCAAFSKSLCVPYMQVWYTEFCGYCPFFSRTFFLYDYPSLYYQVSQNSDFWRNKPTFFFFRERSSSPLDFSSILKRQNLYNRHLMFNLKGAQGKIYLLQTIHLCSLYDICIGKVVVL